MMLKDVKRCSFFSSFFKYCEGMLIPEVVEVERQNQQGVQQKV